MPRAKLAFIILCIAFFHWLMLNKPYFFDISLNSCVYWIYEFFNLCSIGKIIISNMEVAFYQPTKPTGYNNKFQQVINGNTQFGVPSFCISLFFHS